MPRPLAELRRMEDEERRRSRAHRRLRNADRGKRLLVYALALFVLLLLGRLAGLPFVF